MKHKTSKHLDLLFNHFILINYGLEHNNWLSSKNKIIIPNNFRAKRGNFSQLCTLHFALCTFTSSPSPSSNIREDKRVRGVSHKADMR